MLRTSSAVNVYISSENEEVNRLDFSLIGGIIDLKLFIHSDIKQLINLYRQFIGSHAVPAFW
jgi:alpha-glucosidase (family GH31 glycosyl hydrolase)